MEDEEGTYYVMPVDDEDVRQNYLWRQRANLKKTESTEEEDERQDGADG